MKRMILDTDIGPDCDDAAALAMAHIYHKKQMIDLLAVVHCTSNPWGVGTIEVINRWYSNKVLIGTLAENGFLIGEETLKYNRALASSIDPDSFDTYEATALYRRILAEADDHSIDIVAIGPLKNISNLLKSEADEFSNLDGRALVEKKVNRLIAMAGRFDHVINEHCEEAAEWNVEMDISAARHVFQTWPTTIVCSGYELGFSILTGERWCKELVDEHPVKIAYMLYTGGSHRPSWDLTAVQYAAEEPCMDYELSQAGVIKITDEGFSHWSENTHGRHYFILPLSTANDIADKLEAMLCEQIE